MIAGRSLVVLLLCVVLAAGLFHFVGSGAQNSAYQTLTYSDFIAAVGHGDVREVTISGPVVHAIMRDGRMREVYAPADKNLVQRLKERNVRITAKPVDDGSKRFWRVVVSWLPILLLIAVWVFFMRQMHGGSSSAARFGKSRARRLSAVAGRVTFDDVAGIDEAKEELREVVDFLRDPQKFQDVGGRVPRGCLLIGAPGTGKTLLARAIAGEAGVPFFSISGSDFVEMFVGVGAARVRDMFEQGRKHAPCIIFVDEIDAVGRHRGAGLGGGNDEREQTLNQLLVEMDGFDSHDGIILIAATNRPDVLDPALLRPGRFDRQVMVPTPDIRGREQILKVHLRNIQLASDVEPHIIARGTPGCSGAELANLVNEAALLAARAGRRAVTMADFEAARDKAMMGIERRSLAMTESDRRLIACHEAGHALVAFREGTGQRLHRVSIVPRGTALGLTLSLPEEDRHSYSRRELRARLAIALAGRIAEELAFGATEITNGAANDIRAATALARRMVTEFGFSESTGPVRYADGGEEVYLGYAVTQHRQLSDATAEAIDAEVRRLIADAEARARAILAEERAALARLVEALLIHETLTGDDVARILAGEDLADADREEAVVTGEPATGRRPAGAERGAELWRPQPGAHGSNP